MEKRERRTIGGVSVWKMTDKQKAKFMKRDEPIINRSHLFIKDRYPGTSVCFPELGKLSIKKELENEGVCMLSHYTPCKKGKKKVICTISTEVNDTKYLTWKAPSHKVGCCPFIDYIKEG